MISVFSILIFWVMVFSVRLGGEENAAGHKSKVCILAWFPFPLLAWQALGDPSEDAGERQEGGQEAEAVTAGHSH